DFEHGIAHMVLLLSGFAAALTVEENSVQA
ncbi:MAG: hypothetical protein K0R47_5856, partial [Brevibacillus sp.]|nr:hypothetical protein [Brevibacillus sp.]